MDWIEPMIASLAVLALLVGIIAFAWKCGGPPERQGAVALSIVAFMGLIRIEVAGLDINKLDFIGLAIDLAAFLMISRIALHAWRVWPIWAASLQLLAVFAHAVRVLEIGMDPLAYAIMRTSPTYFVSITLLVGTLIHLRLMRAGGNRPSWRVWSQVSHPATPKR
jgi:hypothetical protein